MVAMILSAHAQGALPQSALGSTPAEPLKLQLILQLQSPSGVVKTDGGISDANAARPLALSDALDATLSQSVAIKNQLMDLNLALRQFKVGKHQFLPQSTLESQVERSGASAGETSSGTTSSSGSLASSWQLRNGLTLNASLGHTASKVLNSSQFDTTGNGRNSGATRSLGFSFPLLRGFGTNIVTLNERQNELALESARILFVEAATDVAYHLITAYFELEQARRNVKLARESIERLAQSRKVSDVLLEAGRIPRTIVLQNEVDESQGELVLAQALQAELVAKRELLRQMMVNDQPPYLSDVVLSSSFSALLDTAAVHVDSAIELAVNGRSDVLLAQNGRASALLALDAARDNRRHELNLYGKVDQQRASATVPAINRSVGLSMSVLLDTAQLDLAITSAQMAVEKLDTSFNELIRVARHEVQDAVANIEFARRQRQLAHLTAGLAEQRLSDELLKVRAGRSSSSDLTLAQDALRDARAQENQAEFAIFQAQLQFQKKAGIFLEKWRLDEVVRQLFSSAMSGG